MQPLAISQARPSIAEAAPITDAGTSVCLVQHRQETTVSLLHAVTTLGRHGVRHPRLVATAPACVVVDGKVSLGSALALGARLQVTGRITPVSAALRVKTAEAHTEGGGVAVSVGRLPPRPSDKPRTEASGRGMVGRRANPPQACAIGDVPTSVSTSGALTSEQMGAAAGVTRAPSR